MHCADADVTPEAFPPVWETDEDAEHVEAPHTCNTEDRVSTVLQPASREAIMQDANHYGQSFARDLRALHQFNHDHDCTSTCIKYVAKQCRDAAKDTLRKGKVVACRFWFFHILVFTYVSTTLTGICEFITKRIRRRRKKNW